MARIIATINGKNIYSDKKLASVVDTKVTFSDGSWCDVTTNEIVNNGPGYISIDAPANDLEKMTRGPETFSTNALDISGVNADVKIMTSDGDQMTIVIDGLVPDIDSIDVYQDSNTLFVRGENGNSHTSGANIIMSGRSVNIGCGRVNISTNDPENATKLTIAVPKGSAVCVDNVQGKVTIGNTEGPLQANVLSSNDIKVGKVGDAKLSIKGSGNIDVKSVNGDLSIAVQGSGDVRVKKGLVNQLSVSVKGSGDVRFNGEAVNADLSVMGSGDIDVKSVTNKPVTKIRGIGDINVDNW